MTKTVTKKTKNTKLPAKRVSRKSAGSSVSLLKIKRAKTKKNTKVVITLTFSHRNRHSKKSTKKKTNPPTKRNIYSKALTICLLVVSILGFSYVAEALYAPTEPQTPAYTVITPKQPASIAPKSLAKSTPTTLEIPALSLTSNIAGVGKNADGTMEVPSDPDITGWYTYAPTPGEIGPAVIVGHVDSLKGPAVFWNLNKLQPGDLIHIKRQDDTTATFKVDKQESFEQSNFPTDQVYGNIDHAGLRLITCGGEFNYFTRHYSHNTVIYATLVI